MIWIIFTASWLIVAVTIVMIGIYLSIERYNVLENGNLRDVPEHVSVMVLGGGFASLAFSLFTSMAIDKYLG